MSGHFDVVCFDCDSTLCRIEGVDELAREAGLDFDLAPLTKAAMEGELSFQAIYRQRMEALRPSRAALKRLAGLYLENLFEGATETVAELQARGKSVHIVSGGLRPALLPLAKHLAIPSKNLHAVGLQFEKGGAFKSYQDDSPLCSDQGKAVICRKLAGKKHSVVMIGDGMTDVAAQAAGAFVIGFGGVVHRKSVMRAADRFLSAPSLTALLPFIQ